MKIYPRILLIGTSGKTMFIGGKRGDAHELYIF